MTLMVLKATDHTFLVAGFGRMVGNPYLIPLWKSCPSSGGPVGADVISGEVLPCARSLFLQLRCPVCDQRDRL
jgi:hypothetical protein